MKTQPQKEEALIAFGTIKDFYAEKIDELTELKRLVFQQNDSSIDQQLRSRLRITIESLLIDLNEEVFAISEELAKSFTFERNKQTLGAKVAEYQQRQQHLMKKIKDTVDQNAVVKRLRREQRIKDQNIPSPAKEIQHKDLSTFGKGSLESERGQQLSIKNTSPQVHRKLQRLNNSQQKQSGKKQQYNPVELFQAVSSTRNQQQQQNSMKKRRSPIPLRRKDLNASLTQKQQEEIIILKSASRSKTRRSQSASKKNLTRMDDSHRINETLQSEDFESFLQNKFTKRRESSARKKGKENVLRHNATNATTSNDLKQDELLGSLMLQSEAFQLFAQDFAFMKNRMIQMQNRMNEQDERTRDLEEQMAKLKTENVQLKADVRILSTEQQSLISIVRALEKRHSHVNQENEIFRRMIEGQKQVKGQESNMPQPYNEADQRMSNHGFPGQEISQERRKLSPFSSFLQKHRSFSNFPDSSRGNMDMFDNAHQIDERNVVPLRHKAAFQKQDSQKSKKRIEDSSRSFERADGQISHSFLGTPSQSYVQPDENLSMTRKNENNQSRSFLRLNPQFSQGQISQVHSGFHSIKNSDSVNAQLPPMGAQTFNNNASLTRVNQTPNQRDRAMTQETPSRAVRFGSASRQEPLLSQLQQMNQTRMTPTSIHQEDNLSDWVLERMKK